MNSGNPTSATNTAATPQTAPPPREKLTSELTEAQYLQEQAANAKAALKQTLTDFGQHLAAGADQRGDRRDGRSSGNRRCHRKRQRRRRSRSRRNGVVDNP